MTPATYIQRHWTTQTDAEMAVKLGLYASTIRGARRKLGLRRPKPPVTERQRWWNQIKHERYD